MLKMIVEKGQTKELEIDYRDQNGNPLTPTSFKVIVTERATNKVVATITTFTVEDVGTILVDIPTENLNPGRHYVNIKASNGDYKQEDLIILDIQDHEGTP